MRWNKLKNEWERIVYPEAINRIRAMYGMKMLAEKHKEYIETLVGKQEEDDDFDEDPIRGWEDEGGQ